MASSSSASDPAVPTAGSASSTARAVLERLTARGVAIWRDAGELCLRAPRGTLALEDIAILKREKPALLRLLSNADRARPDAPATPPSPEQESILRAAGGVGHVATGLFTLHPPARSGALAGALAAVLGRHDAFRVRVESDGQGSARLRFSAPPPQPRLVALDGLAPAASEAALARLVDGEARRPFDLTGEPPARVIVAVADGRAVALALSAHHTIMDRWSMDVLGAELTDALMAIERGAPWRAPPAQSFAEAIAARLAALATPEVKAATRAAAAAMRAPAAALVLHGGRRLETFGVPAQRVVRRIPETLAARLAARGRGSAVLIAALGVVLRRVAEGKGPIRLGLPVARRNDLASQATVGLFAATTPLLLRPNPDATAAEAVAGAAAAIDAALALRDADLRGAEVSAGSDGAPGFQVIVSVQATWRHDGAGRFRASPTPTALAKADLVAFVEPGTLVLEYPEGIGDPHLVARLAEDVLAVAARLVAAPGETLARIDPPPALATPAAPRPPGVDTLAGLLLEQARRRPDAVALVDGGRDTAATWSYAALARRVAAVAAALAARGAGPEHLVGVAVTGAAARVVAALAVLWAGAAYVPIDPRWPAPRRYAAAARTALVLVEDEAEASLLRRPAISIAGAADEGVARAREPVAAPETALAWVLPTSGSTGESKTVGIERRNAAALLSWTARAYAPEDLRRTLAMTPLSFDLSVFEMLAPLAAGSAVVALESPLDTALRLPACAPSLVNTTPSIFREVLRVGARLPRGAVVNLAGEPFGADLARAARDAGAARVVNLYGPCETTTYATVAEIEAGLERSLPIGRPIAGTRVRLGDPSDPAGADAWHGEIVIGGAGVARGYLDAPAETAARFRPDPDGPPGSRAYWTGDRATVDADGALVFLGRRDRQVKRRGVRIELDGVEAALVAHPRVAVAAAIARMETGGQRIVAFVAPTPGPPLDPEALVADLPRTMAPDVVHVLDRLPETTSGKIDRVALTALPIAPRTATPPADAREAAVAAIWGDIVGRTIVDRRARFFEVGGDSLKLMRVAERLNQSFGLALSPVDLLRHPTLADVARLLPADPGSGVATGGGG